MDIVTIFAYMVTMSIGPKLQALRALAETFAAEPPPKDAKARTRARILRAATALFAKHGYRQTSVEEVAREAGVAKGTVYVHFATKNELLLHAIAEEKKGVMGMFLPLLVEDHSPSERLRLHIERSLLALPKMPLMARLLAGDRELIMFLAELGPELPEELQRSQALGLEALLEGVGAYDELPAAEQRGRAAALKAMLFSAAQLMDERLRDGLSPEAFARAVARTIVDGVGAP